MPLFLLIGIDENWNQIKKFVIFIWHTSASTLHIFHLQLKIPTFFNNDTIVIVILSLHFWLRDNFRGRESLNEGGINESGFLYKCLKSPFRLFCKGGLQIYLHNNVLSLYI